MPRSPNHNSRKTACIHGHSYLDPANVHRDSLGRRSCVTCRKVHAAKRWRSAPTPEGIEMKLWRRSHGMSQCTLAELLRCGRYTVDAFERGRRRLPGRTLMEWKMLRQQWTFDHERRAAS